MNDQRVCINLEKHNGWNDNCLVNQKKKELPLLRLFLENNAHGGNLKRPFGLGDLILAVVILGNVCDAIRVRHLKDKTFNFDAKQYCHDNGNIIINYTCPKSKNRYTIEYFIFEIQI